MYCVYTIVIVVYLYTINLYIKITILYILKLLYLHKDVYMTKSSQAPIGRYSLIFFLTHSLSWYS